MPDWVVALAAAVGGSLVGLLVGFLLYKCCCKTYVMLDLSLAIFISLHDFIHLRIMSVRWRYISTCLSHEYLNYMILHIT